MAKNYCLDVEFINIDSSNFFMKGETKVSKVHDAHLTLSDNEIELKIFFDPRSYFDDKFTDWIGEISRNKFGSFLRIELSKKDSNHGLQKVDLSETTLIGYKTSTRNITNGQSYIILKLDTVKLYWSPFDAEVQVGQFYLGEQGFKVLESFYSVLFPKTWGEDDSHFEIGRMSSAKEYYNLGKSKFRPEFDFILQDDLTTKTATITKDPKIKFYYKNGITEKEAIHYGDVVLLLASFYHHRKIEYTFRTIYLPEHTIQIKNVEQKKLINNNANLRSLGIKGDFNKFLQLSWETQTLKHFPLLSKAVELFNQSVLVDNTSAFLIRYNIMEICNKQQGNKDKFTRILSKNEEKRKQAEALKILLETKHEKEHDEFKKRWESVQSRLQEKPMANQLALFLESQDLDPKTFPLKFKDLKNLRNEITHGSAKSVQSEELRKANILLYRICGILILNLMGIKNWKFDTELK